jgi:hypothetical protein
MLKIIKKLPKNTFFDTKNWQFLPKNNPFDTEKLLKKYPF